jgi:hypothetical protein
MSFCTLSNFVVKDTIAIFPNGSRNGGVSSLAISKIACAALIGSPSCLPSSTFISL